MHWTLLDMSPLFAAMLLDRQYGGLQSLTDYKFVSRCLRMLREEFSYRPPLTVGLALHLNSVKIKYIFPSNAVFEAPYLSNPSKLDDINSW